jgi:hypothetical protein
VIASANHFIRMPVNEELSQVDEVRNPNLNLFLYLKWVGCILLRYFFTVVKYHVHNDAALNFCKGFSCFCSCIG